MSQTLSEALGPDFELIRLIGKGKQSEVHLAREIPLDRLVAVKVLLAGLVQDAVARARFEREAKAFASLNHPNAASVFRFGFLADGTPFLVLQYVHGRTLESRLEAEGPLSPADARRVIHDVAGALAAAHEHGFVHRDVRPANVMCDAAAGRCVLTDFGVAGLLPRGGSGDPRLTKTGEFLGDVEHMSPEVLSDHDATEASDVYALGVLGYEILTGRGPYSHLPPAGRVAAKLHGTPPRLSTLLSERDPEVEDILERCLSAAPDRRPTAEFIERALGPEGGAKVPWRAPTGAPRGLVTSLMSRRFPQFLAATAGAGWITLEGVSQLVDMGMLGHLWYRLALTTVVCGVLASAVVAWFHGAKGKQRTGPLEIALLSAIGIVWLLLSVGAILPG
jgi:serine/threonine protein kinase